MKDYDINNIEQLKALASAAKRLEESCSNKDWKEAYRDLRKGCDKLWRLLQGSQIKP